MADFDGMAVDAFACERGPQNVDEILVAAVDPKNQSRIRVRQGLRGPLTFWRSCRDRQP